jgi:hypothetical protein
MPAAEELDAVELLELRGAAPAREAKTIGQE